MQNIDRKLKTKTNCLTKNIKMEKNEFLKSLY